MALAAPRFLMVMIWLLSDWFGRAYETTLWPLLGFVFMPFTTLAYMAAMLNNNGHVSGLWIVLLVLAVLTDLGSDGEASRQGSRRRKRAHAKAG
jgi:thiol:disulfide interchange protein